MERMAANPKLGSPKWNGVVTPKNAASPTPSKSVIPRTVATTVPIIRPRSTAILLTKLPKKR